MYIESRDVGFVRPGDRVTIKLDAFQFIEHGTAEGEVLSISDGTFNVNSGMATVSTIGSNAANSTGPTGSPSSTGSVHRAIQEHQPTTRYGSALRV